MEDARYWIWLQDVMGVGARVDLLLDTFATAKDVYNATADELRASDVLDKRRLERALDKSLEKADGIVAQCEESGYKIVTPDSPDYPERLKLTTDHPLTLYVCGDVKALHCDKIHIGVIGSRRPSQYGMDVADSVAISLALGGAVVVSGGALGIDSIAHSSSITAGGQTILIMGCGLDYPYLADNEPLRRRVAQNGALISEYPPKTPPMRGSFVKRNRITAGLCNGILVVEAGIKSGSLSTANIAIKYSRDLFVVTGDARGDNFLGANELAKKGARVVFSADDILTLYGYEIRNRESFNFSLFHQRELMGISDFYEEQRRLILKNLRKKKSGSKKKNQAKNKNTAKVKAEAEIELENEEEYEIDISAFSPDAQTVYALLGAEHMAIDEISRQAHLQIRNVLIALTELEMADAVECNAGNEYRKVYR